MDDLQAELERLMQAKMAEEEADKLHDYMQQDVEDHTPEVMKMTEDSDGNSVNRFKRIIKGL